MVVPHPTLDEQKAAARAEALARRADCDPALGQRLATPILAAGLIPAGAAIAGFWPMGPEIDIRPLLEALAARGHPIALPRTPRRGNPLDFRQWWPGTPLERGPFGTSQPGPDAPGITPGLFLVPLLAFDAAGRRLGYGGGYYDRTLPLYPDAPRLGCAYAAQQMAEVPAGPLDIRLDWVATEAGLLRCEG